MTQFLMGNSVTPAYAYNSRLQLTIAQAAVAYNPSAYLFVEWLNWGTTNNNGTLQSVTVQAGGPGAWGSLPVYSTQFWYDTLNRLDTVVDANNYARAFSYDAYGNMWVTPNTAWGIAPAGPTSNVYNNNNQASTLSYDGSGRVTNTGSTSFSYDAENRQTQATDAPGIGGGTVTYAYDGAGERVKKQISGGAATIYVHDAFGQLVAEYSIAQNTAPCATCYVVSDHLGSTRMLTDQNGNVVARHDFQPFGEEIQANQAGRGSFYGSTMDVEQKFTGQLRDAETGNDYFHARYYMPTHGRFMSPDPANAGADLYNPQSWNAYAYVLGNPLGLVDPSGMAGKTIWIQIPTHCYQTELTGLPGEYQVCDITLEQVSVGPTNVPGDPGGHPNGPEQPPKNGKRLRRSASPEGYNGSA